ncbi:Glutamate 5-kinase [Varanus komodoensis]|nr:Glutamate 5-kinase [Varanus komodoensis]
MYKVWEQNIQFLLKHPQPNSVVIESSQGRQTREHSTPADKEGRKIDMMSYRICAAMGLGLRISSYKATMARYQFFLWQKIESLAAYLPNQQRELACLFIREAMQLSRQQLNTARHHGLAEKLTPHLGVPSDRLVLTIVEHGYKIVFETVPPSSLIRYTAASQALLDEVTELLRKGAIRKLHSSEGLHGFYSRYFMVPKQDGGLCPILDLHGVNKYILKNQSDYTPEYTPVTQKRGLVHIPDLLASINTVCSLPDRLGLCINTEKLSLVPSQVISFIGACLDFTHTSLPSLGPRGKTAFFNPMYHCPMECLCTLEPTQGTWHGHETTRHTNYLELPVVFKALCSFQIILPDRMVHIALDNLVTVFYINEQGRMKSVLLTHLTLCMWNWCIAHRNTPRAVYLAGTDNIDLFVTYDNSICRIYCSRVGIGLDSVRDALMILWENKFFHVFHRYR